MSYFVLIKKKLDYNVDLKIYDCCLDSYVNIIETISRPLRCLACFESILEICIAYIATKISKSLGFLSRLRHFVPSSTLLNIYRSLIQPYISYGLALWVQAVQSNLILIITITKLSNLIGSQLP